jgi:hypothetical protein
MSFFATPQQPVPQSNTDETQRGISVQLADAKAWLVTARARYNATERGTIDRAHALADLMNAEREVRRLSSIPMNSMAGV